jgi:hypothetical protein
MEANRMNIDAFAKSTITLRVMAQTKALQTLFGLSYDFCDRVNIDRPSKSLFNRKDEAEH